MNKIIAFIRGLNFTTILIAIAVILAILLFRQCDRSSKLKSDLTYEKTKNSQNLTAMNEVIKIVTTQNGEIEASKAAYIGSVEELKQYNMSLYNQLKDQKGMLAGIYSNLSIKLDSIIAKTDKPIQYNDSTYGIRFASNYADSGFRNRINGETKFMIANKKVSPINTIIFSNEMDIDMVYGFRELADRYEVFAVSKSDKVKFNQVEGVFTLKKTETIPVKKNKWGVGPQLGVTYNIANKSISPYVGFGVSYNIIRF